MTFLKRRISAAVWELLLVLVAAVWFVALQLFVIKAVCPWCMTAHGLGFVAGLLLLIGAPPRQLEASERPCV